jgi:hypothetical protein
MPPPHGKQKHASDYPMSPGENTQSFQDNHLPFDDSDFYSMKLVLEDWAKRGFDGDLNSTRAAAGYVSITTENWVPGQAPFLHFEIHKLKGKKRIFWQGCNWVARIFTCDSRSGAFQKMHGCIGDEPTLIYTLNSVPNRGWNGFEYGGSFDLEHFYLYR